MPHRFVEAGQLSGTPIDAEKLDEAVRFIHQTTILSGLDLARDVGRYVPDTFFDGDYASFANPSSGKEISFRALLERQGAAPGRPVRLAGRRIEAVAAMKGAPDRDEIRRWLLAKLGQLADVLAAEVARGRGEGAP